MSPEAKTRIKTSWISVSCIALIGTMLGIAYSAGLKTSASAHQIADVNERVRDCEIEVDSVRDTVSREVVRSIKADNSQDANLHQIQIQNAVTNNTLRQIQESLKDLRMRDD